MKILVIGGTGFIGRHLCSSLAREHEVVVMARRLPDSNDNVSRLPGVTYTQGDMTNREDVFRVVEGVDYIVHMPSTVIPSTSNLDPVFDIQTNLVGAINVLDAAVKHSVKKLVFISSGGTVYGEGIGKPFKESDPTNPICSYGVVKLAIEKYIKMYHSLYALPYAILRVSNPYGPGQISDKPLGVVSIFIDRILKGEQLEVWGDGSTSRDFVYIDDLVSAIELSIFSRGLSDLLNIGGGGAVSLKRLLEIISKQSGVSPKIVYTESRDFDVSSVSLDISRAFTILGWEPKVTLPDGVGRTIFPV